MATIYVREQGAMVQKQGERICVSKNTKELLEIPVFNIDDLAIMGNVQITTQALHLLLQRGVDISYFNYGGKYLGHTAAETSKNIFLRFSQYKMYDDISRRLAIAKIIVENKACNQAEMLCQYRWEDKEWKKDEQHIRKLIANISSAETTNELLGIEGMCSNLYFHSYGNMFKCDFKFNGRTRRPPKDPINVIISLGYTFLTKELCSALEAESFETYLGFLHGIRYGRKSLALDIIEEFRQPIVDRLALKLFNKQMLGKYDFEMEDGRVILNTDGFRKFCKEYEIWMTRPAGVDGRKNYRNIIRDQISLLKKCIQLNEVYKPFSWKQEKMEEERTNVCDKL